MDNLYIVYSFLYNHYYCNLYTLYIILYRAIIELILVLFFFYRLSFCSGIFDFDKIHNIYLFYSYFHFYELLPRSPFTKELSPGWMKLIL